jgi:ATP-dependent DNA ligase
MRKRAYVPYLLTRGTDGIPTEETGCDRDQGALPRLPALGDVDRQVPSGERWVHEIKFDGYRVQLHLANNGVKVFTRRGNDWTKRFRPSAIFIRLPSAIVIVQLIRRMIPARIIAR